MKLEDLNRLIERVNRGDMEALEPLMARAEAALRGKTWVHKGEDMSYGPEDIIQETKLAIWARLPKNRKSFTDFKDFCKYFHNCIRDARKKLRAPFLKESGAKKNKKNKETRKGSGVAIRVPMDRVNSDR